MTKKVEWSKSGEETKTRIVFNSNYIHWKKQFVFQIWLRTSFIEFTQLNFFMRNCTREIYIFRIYNERRKSNETAKYWKYTGKEIFRILEILECYYP